jgi:hypothetical protein
LNRFAAFGFVKVEGEGGAACHGVVFQYFGGCGRGVMDAPDDDCAVIAVRLGFMRCALNPKVNF